MREVIKTCRAVMWVALTYTLICHGLTLAGVLTNNRHAVALGQESAVFAPVPLILAMVLLPLGCALAVWWKKRAVVGVAITVLGGVFLAVSAIRLGAHFTVNANTGAGLTTVKLITRHWSGLLVPIAAVAAWLCEAVPRMRQVPTAVALAESEYPADAPQGSVYLECAVCGARFFNAPASGTFRCPYCRKKLAMPQKNWDGQKKKRSVAARERDRA